MCVIDSLSSDLAFFNGTVFVATRDGMVTALQAATGAMQWSVSIGGVYNVSEQAPVGPSPSVHAGLGFVFLGTASSPSGPAVVALHAASGLIAWTFVGPQLINPQSALVVGDMLVFGDVGPRGMVYAVSARTGAVMWYTQGSFPLPVGSSPVASADGSAVYVCTTATVMAVTAHDGSIMWQVCACEDSKRGVNGCNV